MIRKQEGTFLSEADGLEISALCIMPEEKTGTEQWFSWFME